MSSQFELEISARNSFLEELKKTTSALEKLQQVTDEVNTKQNEGMKEVAKNFLEREKSVARETLAWAKQSETVDKMTSTITKINAQKGLGTKAAEQTVADLKAQETELAKVYAELERIGVKGEQLIQDIANAANAGNGDEVNRLVKEFTDGLDPELAKAFTDEFQKGFDEATVAISNPVRELKELKRQINSGELEGDALAVATRRAAELTDTIGDTNARLKALSSDTFAVDAVISGVEQLAGAFTLVQGAAGLFTEDNEELEKALLKVNSAMAVLQGVQSVQAALLDESASKTAILIQLEKLRAFVTDQTTGKLKAANVAMLATVGGAVIAGLVLLIANWDKLKAAITGVTEERELNSQVTKQAIEDSAEEVAGLETRLRVIKAMEPGDQKRTDLIKELQEEYPRYLSNIDAEKVSTEELTVAVDRLKQAYIEEAKIKAAQDLITEETKKQLEAQTRSIEESLGLFDKASVGFELLYKDREELEKSALEAKKQNDAADIAQSQSKIDAIFKLQDTARKNLEALGGATSQSDEEIEAERAAAEAQKQAIQARQAALKKAQEEEKRIAEQRLASRKELQAEFDKLLDEAEKNEIEALTGEDKILAQLAYNDQLITVQEEGLRQLIEQTGTAGAERAAQEAELERFVADLRKQAIVEANAEIAALRATEAAKAAEQSEAALDREEQIILAQEATRLNIQRSSFAGEEDFQTAKEEALLQVQLTFAQRRLELLQGTLTAEQEVERAQLELRISEIQNAIKDGQEKLKSTSVTSLDGFLMKAFGVDEEQVGVIKDALTRLGQEAANLIGQAIQANIDQNQALIDSIDERINKQQEAIDREMELAEEGKANSVNVEKQRLSELNRQRENALKEQEKLKKRQVLLDSAVQLSSLITASANIFKTLSGAGPFGVPLAIGLIATMFASFAASKVKAFQSASQTSQLRKGASGSDTGFITGKTHEAGGERFLDHIEVETGEAWGVINAAASRRHGKYFHSMVEAMNAGKDPRQPMMNPMLYIAQAKSASKDLNDEKMLDISIMVNQQRDTNRRLDSVTQELAGIKKALADQPKTWMEGDTTVVQKGARIYKKTVKG